MHLNNERVVHFLKYLPLCLSMVQLVPGQEICLLEHLHCKKFMCVFLLNQKNFAKAASTDNPNYLEVVLVYLL